MICLTLSRLGEVFLENITFFLLMKNFVKIREMRPDLNGNPFFLVLGKALAKKDWEWKAEMCAIKK